MTRLEIQHDLLKRFDPRARLAAGVFLLLIAVNVSKGIVLSGIISICLLLLCRDFIRAAKRLGPLEIFCGLFLVQALCGVLEPPAAAVFILRLNCAALIYMLAVVPLGTENFARTLVLLHVNKKLVSIVYLSCRYIHLMHDSVFFSIKAMRLRKNPHLKGTLFLWKSYAAVFAAALVKAFIKADNVTMALQKRGFDGIIPQTVQAEWGLKDTVLVLGAGTGLLVYGTYKTFGHLFFL
ncbi:MAG: energy-coupling factor transporter transmembrane protein EcfT [Treponema sp.]|nr:energy-coupling factor transporter transmembrane protein EcfT [Treponema sp.]